MAIINPSSSITRPANTTAYAAGDLVANSATAGDVTPFSFDVSALAQRRGRIKRVRLYKSAVSATDATFTLHMLLPDDGDAAPTVANGDNGALSISSAMTAYLGSVQVDMSSGAEAGASVGLVDAAAVSPEITFEIPRSAVVLYGFLEADAAYTPASAEVFKAWLEIEA